MNHELGQTSNNNENGEWESLSKISTENREMMIQNLKRILAERDGTEQKLSDEYYDFVAKTLERAESESKTEQE